MLCSSGSYNTAKQNYPCSVASYNTRPGNEVGLYYNAPEPTRGSVLGTLTTNYTIYSAALRRRHLAHGLHFIQCTHRLLFSSILLLQIADLFVELRISCLVLFQYNRLLTDLLLSFSDAVSGSSFNNLIFFAISIPRDFV